MKSKAFLIIFLLPFMAKAQNHIEETVFNAATHNKIYFVEFGDRQVLELIRANDNTISATLTNAVWKLASNKGKGEIVTQKISLSANDAKALFISLEQNGFDTIPDSACQGVDGEKTTFITQTADHVNDAEYQELDSNYCEKETAVFEKIVNARTLTGKIEKYIKVKEAFKAFTNSLAKGKYTYGMVILEKK